jgi:hypothetical protein
LKLVSTFAFNFNLRRYSKGEEDYFNSEDDDDDDEGMDADAVAAAAAGDDADDGPIGPPLPPGPSGPDSPLPGPSLRGAPNLPPLSARFVPMRSTFSPLVRPCRFNR